MVRNGHVFVHSSSFVDEPADIGNGTKVWHFCHIMSDVSIGRDCILGQNTFVGKGVRIGNGVKIQNNVSIFQGVTLEDDVFCGPSVVFTNVLNPRSAVKRTDQFGPTVVRQGASLGANSTILCGVTIGMFALVGAGAVVTNDVPDHALVVGVPGRRIGWACECGVTLTRSDDRWKCSDCHKRYVTHRDRLVLATPGTRNFDQGTA